MALTADQIAALRQGHAVAKLCVEIDATTPLRYCTGLNPAQVGSDWYYPRWMKGSAIDLTDPKNSKTNVEIDDRDRVLETANYSDRFSGYDASIHMLLRQVDEASWTLASSFTWIIERGFARESSIFVLHLYAAAGTKQRYGLMVGNTSVFPWAPEAGETFTFAGTTTTTTGGNPINPYAELYKAPSTYWSLLDPTGIMAYEAGLERPYWVTEENWAALGGS